MKFVNFCVGESGKNSCYRENNYEPLYSGNQDIPPEPTDISSADSLGTFLQN
jgi:hypothetical protein